MVERRTLRRRALGVAVPLLGSCCALAQHYVVDASGGGNFLDLPQAIAAVPDGAQIYVRSGTYSAFSVQAKGLTIVGAAGSTVVGANATVDVSNVPAGKRVWIGGITISGLSTGLRVANCPGSVCLQSISSASTKLTATVQSCADVHFDGMSLTNGSPALAVASARLELRNCVLAGMSGTSFITIGGADGGDGADISGSVVTMYGTSVTGGDGLTNYRPAFGGHGLVVTSGSTVFVYGGGTVKSGLGGSYQAQPGQNGYSIKVADSTVSVGNTSLQGAVFGSITQVSAYPITISLQGSVAPAAPVQLVLNYPQPSLPAALWLGDTTTVQPLSYLQLGALLVVPQIVLGPMQTNAQGTLVVPFVVPAGWPGGVPLFAQFATYDPVSTVVAVSGSQTLVGYY